ncbi:hypothetical protein BDQ17DRAFT_1393727 [Cyathus striatus]|nr:hypothetical protein BDQ17DRAFT_1393727 [Cyathus striatus]
MVKMIVVDGIVMGPTHCAFENCSEPLKNAHTGVFCITHESQHKNLCRMKDCYNQKEDLKLVFGRQSVLGIQRIIRRTEQEGAPEWMSETNRGNFRPHDEVPNATLLPLGESQIIDFLEFVYPTPNVRPSYVCIDKACMVLRHLITSRNWNIWKTSTRFVVDSFHYINHRVGDYLCHKFCNPSPLNGSAPNLVLVERDAEGNPHYKRAFNTQACEQLNAWLGGFQSILNRMTVDNFNWTTHAMLFIHTQCVLMKQNLKQTQTTNANDDNVEEDGIELDRVE